MAEAVIGRRTKRGRESTNLRSISCCPLLGRAKKLYGRKHLHRLRLKGAEVRHHHAWCGAPVRCTLPEATGRLRWNHSLVRCGVSGYLRWRWNR